MTVLSHNIAPSRQFAARGAQHGMSLVELMVSVTIGLVILAALVALFVNSSRSNRELARANDVIENGRLAIQVLESDLVHAGFWGTFVPEYDNQTSDVAPVDVPTAVPDPCLEYDPADWDTAYQRNLIGLPVQVYETAAVCDDIIDDPLIAPPKLPDTDVLIVRHNETCVPGEGGNCDADVAGQLYFQPAQCPTDTPLYVFGTANFTRTQRDCATVAVKRRFMSSIYYIGDNGGIPTLMRSQFDLVGGDLKHNTPVPMIEGIQGFRVELGVDDESETGGAVNYNVPVNWTDPDVRTTPTNRGDGVPDDDFVRCTAATPCTVGQLMNVTAVRLYVLVRSREPSPGYTDTKTYALGSAAAVGPFGDGFKRHVFMTTVRLPNIAGRRVTP